MRGLGEGIAFAGFCLATAWLEIAGYPAVGLWALAVAWVIFTDWGQKHGG